jgi:two-component system cell cycle sensor histidine kinase/response regulator CckA
MKEVILFIDDEPLILEAATEFLTLAGYLIHPFDNPKTALSACASIPTIHCAVIDLDLPELTGTETYALLLEQYPNLPVLFTSGYDLSVPESSHQKFISKPFRFEAIISAIKTVTRAKREKENA